MTTNSDAVSGTAPLPLLQTCQRLLMVRPRSFGFNEATAASNPLQHRPDGAAEASNAAACAEFDAMERALGAEGIEVCVVDDVSPPLRPDAIFPNNWISFHADGTVVLYPMMAANRRVERREDVITTVCRTTGFVISRRLDLSAHELRGRYLEGTGSLVLDHVERIAYACRSPRTDAALVEEWAAQMGYRPHIFDASDARQIPYYHTNVLMWIGSRCAMACLEAVADADRDALRHRLQASGRRLFEIDRAAVGAFAGNMLELATWDEALGDSSVLVMSSAARAALPAALGAELVSCVDAVLVVPVPTIERIGGGSVRCMMAEIPVQSLPERGR
jgi:hypothetical protein